MLTKAAHCLVRAQKFLRQAREAMKEERDANPFWLDGAGKAVDEMLHKGQTAETALKEAGAWKEEK